MAGYTRQDNSSSIANGNVVDADILNDEYDAIETAFSDTSGHAHDGTTGNGAPITVVGPGQDITVSNSAVTPKTDDTYDLGSALLEFKDLYLDGVAYVDTLTADAGTIGGADIVTTTATQTLTNKTLTTPTISGNLTVTGTVDGRDLAVDGAKLDLIEPEAKDDQTGAEIKALYEAEADTNAFTDAEKAKLLAIEPSATADQTGSEIKALYEAEADTNAFTDAEKTRLGLVTDTEIGILAGATVTTTELNYLDITTLGTSEASKAVTADAGGQVTIDGSYVGNVTAVAALDIDCSAGNYFTKTIAANSTFTFSSVPSTGSYAFTLEVTHTSGTITWPASVKWSADTAPTLSTGTTHLFVFVTDDGGTRWRGAALVDYVN